MITGAAELKKKFHIWIENGGSREDFSMIANILDAATTMTDILTAVRPIGLQLMRDGENNVWRIVDQRQNEIVKFRFYENLVGGADVTIV